MKHLLPLILILSLTSCAALQGPKLDPTAIALAYYSQDREYQSLSITGVATLTLQAAPGQSISVTTTSPLDSLSVYPRDPSTLAQMLDGLWKIGTVVGATVVGQEMVSGLSRGPTVVTQPAPVIVGE